MNQQGYRSGEKVARYQYRYRGESDGYRYKQKHPDAAQAHLRIQRTENDMQSVTHINAHGIELGNGTRDALDTNGFGGFGGFDGSIIGTTLGDSGEKDIVLLAEQEAVLQENAYRIIAKALRGASVHLPNEQTVYLPLRQPDKTYNFPAQFNQEENKLETLYPTLHLRTDNGDKVTLRIGYLSGQYRDGVKVRRSLFTQHTQAVRASGVIDNLPPYGLNIPRKLDAVKQVPVTEDDPDVAFTQRKWGIRRVTERVYRSPEGIQAFLESKGLTGKAVLTPLLFTLLRSGLPVSDTLVRQAEAIGAISLGVIRSNVLFIPYKGKVFSVITDKSTLLDEVDVAKVQAFLQAAVANNLFAEEQQAIEFIIRDIEHDRFFAEVGDKKIGVTWKG